MTEPDAAGVSLKLLVLKSRQVDKLRAFYQSLGITFTQEQHGQGPVHYSGAVAGAVLEIYPLPDDTSTADRATRLGFAVSRLEQVVENLRASGTPVTSPPQQTAWGYRAVVQDPDGRPVELYQA
jgi:predicted enzyme related to lactoylglutathione lyase